MPKLVVDINTNASEVLAAVRKAIVAEWATSLVPMQLALPMVIALLNRDPIARAMFAEAYGEQLYKAHADDSYDDVLLKALEELSDTKAGRCEYVPAETPDG